MKALVIYGGRFQPPHKGHKASYDYLVNKFGANSVYMASADKPPGPKDPFTWDEKKRIAVSMGVPTNKFAKIKNVYNMDLIQQGIPFNKEDTILIVALSQKDGDRLVGNVADDGYSYKKNGDKAAIQWLRKDPQPASSGEFYVVATPTVEFPVAGENVTGATQIRDMYATADSDKRQQILHDLYDNVTSQMRSLFDNRLGIVKTEGLMREFVEFIKRY